MPHSSSWDTTFLCLSCAPLALCCLVADGVCGCLQMLKQLRKDQSELPAYAFKGIGLPHTFIGTWQLNCLPAGKMAFFFFFVPFGVITTDQILEALQQYDTVVIAGDTGCGKSTQVPQVPDCQRHCLPLISAFYNSCWHWWSVHGYLGLLSTCYKPGIAGLLSLSLGALVQ